jgi:hypothetical protein
LAAVVGNRHCDLRSEPLEKQRDQSQDRYGQRGWFRDLGGKDAGAAVGEVELKKDRLPVVERL